MKPKHLYRRLFAEARPFALHVLGLLLLSVLSALLTLLIPLPLKIAVDSVIGSHPLSGPLAGVLPAAVTSSGTGVLSFAVALLVAIMLLKQIQEFASLVLSTYAGQKLLLNFRARLFGHVQRLSLAYHDTRGVTDSTYRIQYDAQSLQTLVIASLIPFLTAAFTVAGMLYVTVRIDWRLGLIALAVTPPLLVTFYLYRRRLRRQWHEAKQLESSALSVVQEALSALRVVKAFGQEDREGERFLGRSGESMRVQIGLAFAEGSFGVLIGLIVALGMAAVLYVGTRSVEAGALTVGELVLVMAYLQQLYEPLQTISKKAGTLQSSLASAERVFALLDEVPDLVESRHPRPLKRAGGAVAFEDVSFAYEAEAVLSNVSFELEPGTSAGIAGATGAGKTTLVSLLTRFYDPTSGRITLDGVDLREYRLADLRNQFAIVLQEPVLFSTSVAENIAYARPDAGRREIEAAASAADAHDFIEKLPDGYETPVGERGMRLSGGERQRISLARAFLKDAPLLILDEPTSSVDVRTEATIMAAMERLISGRTTIMIAHRLGTLEGCDQRLEIDDGRLIRPPRDWHPPPKVVELARRAVEDGGEVRLASQQRLKRSVHRLCFEAGGAPKRVIAKRLSARRARVNQLVAARWLPAAELGWASPQLRGTLPDTGDQGTWQIYDDLGGRALDCAGCDPREVEPVVELLAELHARFAAHPLLDEVREAGEELGIAFFDREVARCAQILESIGSNGLPLSEDRAQLRERLLERMDRLRGERAERGLALRADGGPDTLLHGDLWPANVLILERSGEVEARLIDWDHAGVGPVAYDLSTLLYRLPPRGRPAVLAAYREAAARRGLRLSPEPGLELLFETAECARYACCLAEAALAAARGERWGFQQMAEIETWFAALQPALAESLG